MKLRKLSRRETILLALLAAGAVVVLRGNMDPATAPVTLSRARSDVPLLPVPRIGLDRLEGRRTESEVGRRDLFAFGAAPLTEDDGLDEEDLAPTPPPPITTPPPGADPAGQAMASRLPPLNLKFIGAVGNSKGVQVAVLLTDRNEVLTGQQGDVVANRYRIERIGIESVDLADVGTGQSRRIPLKGN
jgi:hypothetical protein